MEKQKDISEMDCKFTLEQIKKKVKEMYPDFEELDVNYHAHHIQDVDWLKVTDDEDELEQVVREQVEDLHNK